MWHGCTLGIVAASKVLWFDPKLRAKHTVFFTVYPLVCIDLLQALHFSCFPPPNNMQVNGVSTLNCP